MISILKRKFFQRDPKNVALELLGTKLVRKSGLQKFEGMIVETEAARLLTYKAASLIDRGLRGRIETSLCKLYATEVVQRVTYNAIQIHGGYGYIDEYPLERYYRDARLLTIGEGTSQMHKLFIGRQALGISAFI